MDRPQLVNAPDRPLAVSIVSHGHAALVQKLLAQLAQHSGACVARVVLTQNIPDAEPAAPQGGWPFVLDIRRNTRPLGFASNHNRALASAPEPFVCVLNPDVSLLADGADPFAVLLAAAAGPGVGCAYPLQLGEPQGVVQGSERELPSPLRLLQRRLWGRRETRVDWVNAACIVVPTPVWRQLGGFDERYFMYCEDVDLCLRMRLRGLRLVRADARVVHRGQRASGRDLRHLWWHVSSLLRLWTSPAYRQAQQLLT